MKTSRIPWLVIGVVLLLLVLAVAAGFVSGLREGRGEIGHVLDEAKLAGRAAASFPAAEEDYYHDMDGGVPLSVDEVKGRNTWIAWTAGNDRFWDGIGATAYGALDFLKTISTHPHSLVLHGLEGADPVVDRRMRVEEVVPLRLALVRLLVQRFLDPQMGGRLR